MFLFLVLWFWACYLPAFKCMEPVPEFAMGDLGLLFTSHSWHLGLLWTMLSSVQWWLCTRSYGRQIITSKLVGMSKILRLVSERHHSFKNISDSISSLSLVIFFFWSIKHCWNFLSFSVLTIHYYCLVQVFVF